MATHNNNNNNKQTAPPAVKARGNTANQLYSIPRGWVSNRTEASRYGCALRSKPHRYFAPVCPDCPTVRAVGYTRCVMPGRAPPPHSTSFTSRQGARTRISRSRSPATGATPALDPNLQTTGRNLVKRPLQPQGLPRGRSSHPAKCRVSPGEQAAAVLVPSRAE